MLLANLVEPKAKRVILPGYFTLIIFQADLLNHAMTSAHQAELIALQLHLLSSHSERSVLQVILLDSKSISKLIVSTLR